MSILYQSATTEKPVFDYTIATSHYGIKDNWRALLIPGWAQMHKGSYLKGGLIMGGTVAMAGGSAVTGLMRNGYLAKRANTHSASAKQQYTNKANNMATGMYCCIGGLAAMYIYNIIDAFVTPGARRIGVADGNGVIIYF